MSRKIILRLSSVVLLYVPTTLQANEYVSSASTSKTIHTVTVCNDQCGTVLLSTKVGTLGTAKTCHYEKETPPTALDLCDCSTVYLNGSLLEQMVGRGYTCAASHAQSKLSGKEGLDKYRLIKDGEGHYIYTVLPNGKIVLHP